MGVEIEKPVGTGEIWDEIRLSHNSLLRLDYGIGYLDDSLLGLFPGELTLVGARTGGGKTEFAAQVVLTQASSEKAKRVLYFALDHEPREIENRLLWRGIVKKIRAESPPKFHGVPLRYAEWRAGSYVELMKDFESDARLTLEHLLSTSEIRFVYEKGLSVDEIAAIISSGDFPHEFNLAIVDHFHAMRFKGERWEAQSTAMQTLSKAAEKSQRPVLVMGQFRKRTGTSVRSMVPDMEEFSGPGDLIYIPQNIVVFGPYYMESGGVETLFHVVKARVAGDAKLFVGQHGFDDEAKCYSTRYQLKRFKPMGEPAELLPADIPQWAKRAVKPKVYESGGLPSWEKE